MIIANSPRWLSIISYPTRARGIIVNYLNRRREKYMSPSLHPPLSIILCTAASRPVLISLLFSDSVKKLPGILGALGWCSRGVMGLHHPFFAFGGAPEALKAWIEAPVGGQYLLYYHIFLPSSVHIISIILAGRFAALV